MQFSTFVRNARIARGFTCKQLADEMGIHYSYLSRLEHGKTVPRIENVLRLARVLKINVGELSKIDDKFELHGAIKVKHERRKKALARR
jgi:transcriptional regulator with XRE-family HTH domain